MPILNYTKHGLCTWSNSWGSSKPLQHNCFINGAKTLFTEAEEFSWYKIDKAYIDSYTCGACLKKFTTPELALSSRRYVCLTCAQEIMYIDTLDRLNKWLINKGGLELARLEATKPQLMISAPGNAYRCTQCSLMRNKAADCWCQECAGYQLHA